MTIERLAAAPLILYDARWAAQDPTRRPAARARPACRRPARAADRGRVHDRGARPRRPRARRHRQPALAADRPRLHAPARHGLPFDPPIVRDVRVHHAPQRPSLAGHPRVHGARRAPRAGAGGKGDTIPPHGGRDRCRRGVPADDLLAPGGGPADDRARTWPARCSSRRRPCTRWSAGWRATATSPRAADKAISFTREGLEHAEAIVRRHRLIERFLTDVLKIPGTTCTRRPSGSSTRCRRCSRRACWPRSATHDVPARAPDPDAGQRIEGVPLGDTEPGAKVKVLRFENEAEDLLHLFKRAGLEPGRRGPRRHVDNEQVTVDFDGRPRRSRARWPKPCR